MYTFDKQLRGMTFEDAIARTKQVLATKGFGVLTEIDVQKTMKGKLDADIPAYVILGACNPKMAHEALKAEDKIGTMLPCNVVIQEIDGKTEVAAVDPLASMQAIPNKSLATIAAKVGDELKAAVEAI